MLAEADPTGVATPALPHDYVCEGLFIFRPKLKTTSSVGLMDKASAFGAGDSRFESWADQVGAQEKWQTVE